MKSDCLTRIHMGGWLELYNTQTQALLAGTTSCFSEAPAAAVVFGGDLPTCYHAAKLATKEIDTVSYTCKVESSLLRPNLIAIKLPSWHTWQPFPGGLGKLKAPW
jgi:hypothetical protein